jgi:ABC transporter DrrB family efflux protein
MLTENCSSAGPCMPSQRPSLIAGLARDTATITKRNLLDLWRVPQFLVFTMIQPIIFVVIFRYVFGGALGLSTGGTPYVNYLMPGIFVQTVAFGAITTGISMATDVKSGLLERFRALPMSRAAVLAGRSTSDLIRTMAVMALIVGVGFAVGFRIMTNTLAFFCGILLVLYFAFALLWIFITIGLALGDPESAQAASFPIIAPLVFVSSTLVLVSSMPSWLQGFAKYQPVSVTASAARALSIGGPTTSWALQSVIWSTCILLVFVPIAVLLYRRRV